MKHFKMVRTDGSVEELAVDRVVRDADTIYADSRVEGRWSNIRAIDVDEVDDVRRRITDFNGERRWVRHRTTYLRDRFDVDREERRRGTAPRPLQP